MVTKATSTTPVRKTDAAHTSNAVAEAIIAKANKQHGKGSAPKTGEAKSKPKVGRDWSALGYTVAVRVRTADSAAEVERCEALTEMSIFSSKGFAPASGTGKAKKREFTPEVETFFKGWKKLQEELDTKQGKSFQTRISEARRVCHAYILAYDGQYPGIEEKGSEAADKVTDMLNETGIGYHAKIQSLPVMQLQPRESTTRTSKSKTENHVESLSKAEKEQRTQIVAKFTAEEIGSIVKDLPETLLFALCSAVAVRLQVTKDANLKQIGTTVRALLDSAKRAEDSNAADDAKSKAAAGEQQKQA